MTAMRRGAILLVLLVLTLPSLYSQPGQHYVPEILFANVEGEAVVFGGFIKSGRQSFPLLGFSSGATCKAYFLQIQGYLLNAAAHGDSFFFVGTAYLEGLPVILLVQLRNGEEPQATVIYSDTPLYGVDLLPMNNALYITGYVHRYSPVAELDIIVLKYNYTTGKVEDLIVLGSTAFDDYPKRILLDEENIVIIGDTYSYLVSQSDILIVKIKQDFTLISDIAIGGAGLENVEDALIYNDTLFVIGTTLGKDGTADAFIARISEKEGVLSLLVFTGYGHEFATSVSRFKNSYLLALHGEFEEEKKFTLILNYTLVTPLDLKLQSAFIVNSSADDATPLKSHNTGLIVKTSNFIAELYPEEKALCLGENCPPLVLSLLHYNASNLFYTPYGWRLTRSIIATKEKPKLYTIEINQISKVYVSSANLSVNIQLYVNRIDIVREIIKFIRRSTPLVIFIPMIVATILVVYMSRKRR